MEFPMDWVSDYELEIEQTLGSIKVSNRQTEVEIESWAVSEEISDYEKSQHYFKSGFALQKLWVVQNLQFLLEAQPSKLIRLILVRNIQYYILDWPEDLQLECGKGILVALQKNLVPSELHLEIIEIALTFLSYHSIKLHCKWLPVFEYLLPLLPVQVLRSKVIPEVVLLSDYIQKPMVKIASCQMLAELAKVVPSEFQDSLMKRAKSLSQDPNAEIRERMAKSWTDIIRSLGTNSYQHYIFAEVVKLIDDEVEQIKILAAKILIQTLDLITKDFFNAEVDQVIVKHFYQNPSEKIYKIISENLAKLLDGCFGYHNIENIALIKHLLIRDAECRKNVAIFFTDCVRVLGFCDELKDTAVVLASDTNASVRATFAAGFHQVYANHKSCKALRKIAAGLIEDSETVMAVLKNLQYWSVLLEPSHLLNKFITSLMSPLEWRTHAYLMSAFQDSLYNFNLKSIHDQLIPMLIHKMLTSCWPIKSSACLLLSRIIHHTHQLLKKLDLLRIVNSKLARSVCCFDRILYIEFLMINSQLYSSSFFSKYFLDDYLVSIKDPVPSVQLKFLASTVFVGGYVGSEAIVSTIQQAEIKSPICKEVCSQVLQKFKEIEFLERLRKNSDQNEGKERFEKIQEEKDAKENEIVKRKLTDQISNKINEAKGMVSKKTSFKGKTLDLVSVGKIKKAKSIPVIKPALIGKKNSGLFK